MHLWQLMEWRGSGLILSAPFSAHQASEVEGLQSARTNNWTACLYIYIVKLCCFYCREILGASKHLYWLQIYSNNMAVYLIKLKMWQLFPSLDITFNKNNNPNITIVHNIPNMFFIQSAYSSCLLKSSFIFLDLNINDFTVQQICILMH